MRCPELVGRGAELRRLWDRVDALVEGRGGLVALVGEAGSGKSRLAHELVLRARTGEVPVLEGRAVPAAASEPYRPVREALLGAFRDAPRPSGPSLEGFEAHLGRLVPAWSGSMVAEDSPLMVAEAVLRLLSLHGERRGCVLLLEDVHWADPETALVIEYFVDALRDEPVLCLCTTRDGGGAAEVVDRLRRRAPDAVLPLGRLDAVEVGHMVGSCLGTPDPPLALVDFVGAHGEGSPFMVEELLAGLVAAGELRRDDGRWEVTGPLTPRVPSDLGASVRRRLASLDGDARRVLGAAALLGRQFAWELLPGIAGVDGRAAADALRAAMGEQLVDVDGDGFVFRHALTREAVLADLLPPERRELAGRAWPVVERANPGLPGSSLALAADLAESAGDPHAAATRLVRSARRALDAGAFTTAEATARRARSLGAGAPGLVTDAEEVLVQILTASGKVAEAVAVGVSLLARLERETVSADRRVDLHVALGRAAMAAGEPAVAQAALDGAHAGTPDLDPAARARVEAVAAEVALDRGDLVGAEALARAAADAARVTSQPAVECEALLVLGRVVRPTRPAAARAAFVTAIEVAESAGLTRWHLRGRHELALEEWFERGPEALGEMRSLAVRYGAQVTVAVMDLSLADMALSRFDRAAALRHASDCVAISRRFGLATEAVGNLWLAGAHALGGDDEAMQAAVDAALARDPDDPRVLADLYGRVLLTRALVRDELDEVRPILSRMAVHLEHAPAAQSVYPGRIAWVLVRSIDDDDLGAAAREEFAAVAAGLGMPWFTLGLVLAEAIGLARAGDLDGASALAAAAYDGLLAQPTNAGIVHGAMLLVAPVAVRDGWGAPMEWLRGAEAFFVAAGHERLGRRCRQMLVEAGGRAPRRRGATEVPAGLRALGVTGREVDVLRLVVEGCSNRDIADRLVLSPKTVERHLTSLFARLGVRDRRALAARAGPMLA